MSRWISVWPRARLCILLVAGTLILSGCSAMKLDDYAQQTPALILEDYFAGETRAWGFFSDRFGNVKRRFQVTITGTLVGDELTLDERFVYDNGATERRVWTIQRRGANHYQGRAGDVIGTAEGHTRGNALNWQYHMNLPVGDRTWKVHFDDWMFLQPDQVLLNQATVSKWGITLGRVNLFFSKTAAPASAAVGALP
jgi:hypothetical protein